MEEVHTHPDTETVTPNSDSSFHIPTITQILRPPPAGDVDDERTMSSIVGEQNLRHPFPHLTPETKPELDTETVHVGRRTKLHVQLARQPV
ncbi:hypothetical protein EYC84_002560 [Monilinia fructicola]|uniref:Uncharacterized protein n=1 Tax=Monilinia fructicola TaxID=38448 RepID=A0A5M9JNG3_MONFR|nr:hypothetical protein EYC84_002560 [Monilinia fructicola]